MKNFLIETFLFKNVDDYIMEKILAESPPVVLQYKRGALVYPSDELNGSVGFIVEGKCEIRRKQCDDGRIVLNILTEKESFGILSVYSDDDFPTQIFALKNSTILFFTKEQIQNFVNNYSQISSNLIQFLANRITFLNKRIATFSGNSVEERLATYLLSKQSQYCSDSFTFNRLKTAEEINASRASLYRSLDRLESKGIISLSDKKIIILDPEGLERIVK